LIEKGRQLGQVIAVFARRSSAIIPIIRALNDSLKLSRTLLASFEATSRVDGLIQIKLALGFAASYSQANRPFAHLTPIKENGLQPRSGMGTPCLTKRPRHLSPLIPRACRH
jgi:hypothetical protein